MWNQRGHDFHNTKISSYKSNNLTAWKIVLSKKDESTGGLNNDIIIDSKGFVYVLGLEDEEQTESQELFVINSETGELKISYKLPGMKKNGKMMFGGSAILSKDDEYVVWEKASDDKLSLNSYGSSDLVRWEYKMPKELGTYEPTLHSLVTNDGENEIFIGLLRESYKSDNYKLIGLNITNVPILIDILFTIDVKGESELSVDSSQMVYFVNNSDTIIKVNPVNGKISGFTRLVEDVKLELFKPVISDSLGMIYYTSYIEDDEITNLWGIQMEPLDLIWKVILPVTFEIYPGGPCFVPTFPPDNEKTMYVNCVTIEGSEVMVIDPKNGSVIAEDDTGLATCIGNFDIAFINNQQNKNYSYNSNDRFIIACDAGMLMYKEGKFKVIRETAHSSMFFVDSNNCIFTCHDWPLKCMKSCDIKV